MSDRINCRNCIHFNDLEHRCCLNDGNEIKKECYFILSKRKPKGKDIVIENLKTKISDLEAKVAESEKRLVNCVDFDTWQKTAKENNELKQQLAEKENTITNLIEDSNASKELLKKQLAEKEKQSLKYFNEYRAWKRKCDFLENDQIKILENNQDKISFAVERLEKVKAALNELFENEHGCYVIIDTLDNQIEELKKEMKWYGCNKQKICRINGM